MDFNIWDERMEVDNHVPLYRQLEQIITQYINEGRFKPGDIIPSELEFCTNFNLSRSTVRQALKHLQDKELLIPRRGIGTMVTQPKIHRHLNDLYSFTQQMKELGYRPCSKLLEFKKADASAELAEKMKLSENTPVFIFSRLRIADDRPMLFEKTVIVARFCPDLNPQLLEEGSLYSILSQQYHLDMDYAVETYEPGLIEKKTADLLSCKEKSCAFFISRKAFTKNGEIFELTESVMPGERSKLEITLHQGKISFQRLS